MSRIFFLVIVVLFSCEKNLELTYNSLGNGVEFYLSQSSISYLNINNYSTIQLDTVELQQEPFISYNDILSYDSANYTFTIRFSKYNESFLDLFKDSNNFIVSVDKEPVIFGFFWSLIRSQICPYVHLIEPYEKFDSDNANEIKLYFGYPTSEFAIGEDPRNNPKLISRLKKDGKLKVY